jgi:hypothetical protein
LIRSIPDGIGSRPPGRYDEGNSQLLPDRLMAKIEGRLRARRKHGDVYLDDYMMSRVRGGPDPA